MDDSGGFGAPPPPPPPGAGGGGSIPQRGLGDILSVAFEVYKANAAKLIQIVAVLVIPLTFVLALLTQVAFKQHCDKTSTLSECVSGFGHSLLISAIGWFIAIAIQQLLLGALTRGAAGALRCRRAVSRGRRIAVGVTTGGRIVAARCCGVLAPARVAAALILGVTRRGPLVARGPDDACARVGGTRRRTPRRRVGCAA